MPLPPLLRRVLHHSERQIRPRFNPFLTCYNTQLPYSTRLDIASHTNTHSSSTEPSHALPKADWASHAHSISPRSSLRSDFPERLKSASQDLSDLLEQLPSDADLAMETLMQNDRRYISDRDVDEWLENYEIPQKFIDNCKNDHELLELRRLYARQIRLECSVHDMAVHKNISTRREIGKLGKGSQINSAQNLVINWMHPAAELIAQEQANIVNGVRSMDSTIYGPAILLLNPEIVAALGINMILSSCLIDGCGSRFIKLALSVGRAVQEQIIENKEKRKDTQKYLVTLTRGIKNEYIRAHMVQAYESVGFWGKRLTLKVGAAVVDFIQRSCLVPDHVDLGTSVDGTENVSRAVFYHGYLYERRRRVGVIKLHDSIFNLIMNTNPSANILPWTARYLPMLVPPTPWDGPSNGGYLKLHTKIMRQRDTLWQMDCVGRGDTKELLSALNALAEVPWVINQEVLDVQLKMWHDGGGFGDLPPRTDYAIGEMTDEQASDPEKRLEYDRYVGKMKQQNRDLHSLRCDTLYKLQVAEEFRHEKEMYFPHNLDFRGRVYPIPPNLNHLGSDLSRSLLVFRDRKPLGKAGLRWLKIHLANVYGAGKCNFDERIEFVEKNINKVHASAIDPLGIGDHAWWKDAEYPFLALGVCFELHRALNSPNPEAYLSNIPVHQDGSCNGLQHYAALGRDVSGGEQVNLVPGDRPGDVYKSVAEQVLERIKVDSEVEITDEHTEEQRALLQHRKMYAELLLGSITRKVVKQTVMTSVYGVTYIGARKQIHARLEEIFMNRGQVIDSEMEERIYRSACYVAVLTMDAIGNLFTSARAIMEWLADCASKVAEEGQPMSWITPLGLPVVQPYRRAGCQQVRTKVQHVLMVSSENLPVSTGRQKTAFPPNYVHSLDSTHMLMTARRCIEEDKIAFAAVHDSYWTHACSVDIMNARLREEFVDLYERPLLQDLMKQLTQRFPNTKFNRIPDVGTLDLQKILESPYFFN